MGMDRAAELTLAGDIPQTHGAVLAGAGEHRLVGAEGDALDDPRVTCKRMPDRASALHVPDDDLVVVARRSERLAITAECNAFHNALVAEQWVPDLTRTRHVPNPNRCVEAARDDGASGARESHPR